MDAAWFKSCLKNKTLVKKLQNIKLIITDVDGSLTDCIVYPQENTEETKGYSIQDGFGIQQAIKAGLTIAVVTGKNGKIIEKRINLLKIPKDLQYYGYSKAKIEAVEEIKAKQSLSSDEIMFFGDDTLDIEVKNAIGLFACPENAIFYIKPQSDLIIPKNGGNGAFRLLIDLVLYSQGKHFAQQLIENSL